MKFHKSSIAAIKEAPLIWVISDATGDRPAYFIMTQVGEDAFQRREVSNENGERWTATSREAAIGAVQELRPDLESHHLAAGVVNPPGPHADELDREARDWLLTLSGRRITELDADELMLLSLGYSYGGRLGVRVRLTNTSVQESVPDPRRLSVVERQLRAAGRGDQSPQICRDNAVISVELCD